MGWIQAILLFKGKTELLCLQFHDNGNFISNKLAKKTLHNIHKFMVVFLIKLPYKSLALQWKISTETSTSQYRISQRPFEVAKIKGNKDSTISDSSRSTRTRSHRFSLQTPVYFFQSYWKGQRSALQLISQIRWGI